MKHTIYALTMFALAACTSPKEKAIDRHALVTRKDVYKRQTRNGYL